MKIIKLTEDENLYIEITKALKEGKIIIFPTETIYGLGGDALNPTVLEKIYFIKKRKKEKLFPVLIKDESELYKYVRDIPESIKHLIKLFWPGPLTIIFYPKKDLPEVLTNNGKGIALRVSSSPFIKKLFFYFENPIVATSVNISEEIPLNNPKDIIKNFKDKVDIFIENGEKKGLPSTVVDIRSGKLKIIRKGVLFEKIEKEVLKKLGL